ncbi:MAG: ROK family protein [Candidatus Omnitrophica bacterium]|jgi:glucokinase|nr:ROK family protein [Candidatus Omnitrophota bacterium]
MKKKYSIGIGLNLFDARAILLGSDKKVILEIEKPRKNISANETIKVLLELFEEIISKAKNYKKEEIEGVGLALGGIVNTKKGKVYWPQKQYSSYAYISLPLKEYLEKKFNFPVTIENDANSCVLAEYILNFSEYKDVIYMFSGVGCGIIVDGKLYRGKDGGAGELFLNSTKRMESELGDFSFFRQWPVDLGIVKKAKEVISLGKDTSLIKRITPTGELHLKDIFEEAKRKDKVAREVLKEAAFSLGVKISFLLNLLNPEVVIIGGGLEEAGEFFLDECIDTTKEFSFSEMRKGCRIVFSQLGKSATSLGAALAII